MKQLVYRVENSRGEGPYTGSRWIPRKGLYANHCRVYFMVDKCPTPFKDTGIERDVELEEFCGFLNEEQLYNWFTPSDLKYLERQGFELKRLWVEVTAVGERQVLVKKAD